MTKEDMRNIGKEALRKIDELGITYEAEELDQVLFGYPEDMMTYILENMGTKEIEAMVLEHIAYKYYNQESDTWEGGNDRLYAFDVERFWGDMYGDPLECLNTLFGDEFVISDVKEDFENAEDTGKVSLDFKINDKEYHYDADWHYDWFDTEIFRYIAARTDSEATGKHLYVTSVGPQSIMLVYETEEWAKKFGELFWTLK